jgi:D-alanine-D-alanine ligase-like ATP-grasp enzyme
LIRKSIPTSRFVEFNLDSLTTDIAKAEAEVGYPMIVKPSKSYGSISITKDSVVFNQDQLRQQIDRVSSIMGQHDGIFVEKFLEGREYTVLVAGDRILGIKVFPAAERVFNQNLGKYEKLLVFEKNWESLNPNGKPEKEENFCVYQLAPESMQPSLQKIALEAYLALNGTGYGRVDIRTDSMESPNAYVLEVNANCGLSVNPDGSSSAEILRLCGHSPENFIGSLVEYAMKRKIGHAEVQPETPKDPS